MEEFITNFNEFKEFLNSKATEHIISSLVGENGRITLNVIKYKFEELGLDNAF